MSSGVEQAYHNAPGELLRRAHWRGRHSHDVQIIRGACPSHKGWVPAAKLEIDDRLRTPEGENLIVTDLFANGDIEPVFNLRVADTHTYFVGNGNGEFALVHNVSAGGPPQPSMGTRFNSALQNLWNFDSALTNRARGRDLDAKMQDVEASKKEIGRGHKAAGKDVQIRCRDSGESIEAAFGGSQELPFRGPLPRR